MNITFTEPNLLQAIHMKYIRGLLTAVIPTGVLFLCLLYAML